MTIRDEVIDDSTFAARMTNCQFAALRRHLDKIRLREELGTLPYLQKIKRGANAEPSAVTQLFISGWNTEFLLRQTPTLFSSELLGHAVQWAFPQAYYSAFALTLGYYKAVGHTEQRTHAALIRKFGQLVKLGCYPGRLHFLAQGAQPIEFVGVTKYPLPSTLFLDEADASTVESQICQFLKATRERDLRDRKLNGNERFKTKKGKRKLRLSPQEWRKLSENEGYTSLLSLLYRKRIKSNYQEVGVFFSEDLAAGPLLKDILHVVTCINFVHEVFVTKALGLEWLDSAVRGLPASAVEPVLSRAKLVKELVGGA